MPGNVHCIKDHIISIDGMMCMNITKALKCINGELDGLRAKKIAHADRYR